MGRLESKKRGKPLEIDKVAEAIKTMEGAEFIKLYGSVAWEPVIGQIWRLSWREAHGDREGVIIRTRSWQKYSQAVMLVIEAIRRPPRKREVKFVNMAKLRNSASA